MIKLELAQEFLAYKQTYSLYGWADYYVKEVTIYPKEHSVNEHPCLYLDQMDNTWKEKSIHINPDSFNRWLANRRNSLIEKLED